jgi:hypothetical protein
MLDWCLVADADIGGTAAPIEWGTAIKGGKKTAFAIDHRWNDGADVDAKSHVFRF